MANSSSCLNCGAKLVPGAEICDLCGTLVSLDGASVPDWIDVAKKTGPAYRTIPDPVRPNRSSSDQILASRDGQQIENRSADANLGDAVESDSQEGLLAIEPEEDFFVETVDKENSDPNYSSVPDDHDAGGAEPERDPEPVEVADAEDFFSSESVETSPEEASEVDVADSRGDGTPDPVFDPAEVVQAEDFFSQDGSTSESDEVRAAAEGENPEGPSEMEIARQGGSFENAEVAEVEDFFSGGDDVAETAADESRDERPSEMAAARTDSTIEKADVVAPEIFFSDDSSGQDSPTDAASDDTSGNLPRDEHAGLAAGPAAVSGAAKAVSEASEAKRERSKKGGSRKQKKRKKRRSSGTRESASEGVGSAGGTSPATSIATGTVRPKEGSKPDKQPGVEPPPRTNTGVRSVEHESLIDGSRSSADSPQRPEGERVKQTRKSRPDVQPPVEVEEHHYRRVESARLPRPSARKNTDRQHAPSKPVAVAPSGPNRNAIVVTAAAVLLIGGLFMINALSNQSPEMQDAPRPQMTAVSPIAPPPLSEELEGEANRLKNQIATLSGSRRISKQRELISMYAQERRFDLAAVVQQEIAQSLNSEVEWVRSGNYYYDWMETQAGATKTDYAKLAIASYQRALDINPDNLDVRTNMALAYLYDPSNPMQAIRNTNMVLEKDPDHILANFNRGVMLMQINRLEPAVAQFERVQKLVGDSNSPIYQRAENAIKTIRQHRSQ